MLAVTTDCKTCRVLDRLKEGTFDEGKDGSRGGVADRGPTGCR